MTVRTETWPSGELCVQEVTQPIAALAITLNEPADFWQGLCRLVYLGGRFCGDSEALCNCLLRLYADETIDELAVFEDEQGRYARDAM